MSHTCMYNLIQLTNFALCISYLYINFYVIYLLLTVLSQSDYEVFPR